MGCGSSSDNGASESAVKTKNDDPAEMAKSSAIDRSLQVTAQRDELKVKLLLLGAGESGKSTIFKQMRILHGSPREDDELRMYGVIVRANIIVAVRKLCGLLRTLALEAQLAEEPVVELADGFSVSPKEAFDLICSYLIDFTGDDSALESMSSGKAWVGHSPRAGIGANNDAKLFMYLWRHIKALWDTTTMKEHCWLKRSQANVIDGHKDFLQDMIRISSPTFRPTQQDVLLARVKTTQVVTEKYRIDGIEFEISDVGGQRSERRKWIGYFDTVDAVIFVAALSEYDQCLAEAKRTNRMIEALDLFKSVCNNRAFTNTSIMLFLNKKDIFADKLLYSDIAVQKPFNDYPGAPRDFNSGVLYFIQRFKDCLLDDDFNDSFIHVTCATDTNNMEFVLDSTRTIIMTDNLRRSGFLGPG